MEEILKGKIYDGYYDLIEGKMIITRNYHFRYDRINGIIYGDAPMPVKHLYKLRRMLKDRNIQYKTIIIGKPDI